MRNISLEICLIDDNETFREAVKFFITKNTNWAITYDFSYGAMCFDEIYTMKFPDIILMDYKMPGIDGIWVTKHFLSRFPFLKVIAVSMQNTSLQFMEELIITGFKGFIQKKNLYNQLIPAVEKVYNGGMYFDGVI